MICTQFTVHDFNNCLKFYSVDILQPIFILSFLLPFQFSCLMAGQRNHVLSFLVHELIQALQPGKFSLLVGDYAQLLFQYSRSASANSKITFWGKLQLPFLNIHADFDRAFRFCVPLAKHRKFPALVFMNKQIQRKGDKCQHICVTSSSVQAEPLPTARLQLPRRQTDGCIANLATFLRKLLGILSVMAFILLTVSEALFLLSPPLPSLQDNDWRNKGSVAGLRCFAYDLWW